jgi:hypothetical protein
MSPFGFLPLKLHNNGLLYNMTFRMLIPIFLFVEDGSAGSSLPFLRITGKTAGTVAVQKPVGRSIEII